MKITDKKKPIDTIPKGIWESSRPVRDKEKNNAATALCRPAGKWLSDREAKQTGYVIWQ